MSTPHMGLGLLGDPNITFVDKVRWALSAEFPPNSVPKMYVKVKSRPLYNTQTEELTQDIKSIETTFYDYREDELKPLYNILAKMYEPTEGNRPLTEEELKKLTGTVTLYLYNGIGQHLEEWVLTNAWPTQITFGDFYDETTVEVTWQYGSAEYKKGADYV